MPNETAALVTAKAPSIVTIRTDDGKNWTLSAGNTQTIFQMVEGKFPDWRRIIPAKISNEVADYDFEILMKFVKAAKLLGQKAVSVCVGQNGLSAGRVVINKIPNYLGVIMPKIDHDPKTGLVYRAFPVNPLLTS